MEMFFNDDINRRKVNMGNYSLTSKDDFLKKMKEEENKEKNQKKIDGAKNILRQFFKKNFDIPPKTFLESKLINNLNSVIDLIKKSDFPKEKREKLAILSIKKVSDELLDMLNCRGLSNKILFNLIHTVSEVFSFTTNESISELFKGEEKMKYAKIFLKLIKASIFELYFNIKNDYLINEKFNIFAYLYYLNYVFPVDIKNLIYKSLSRNTSFLYTLNKILLKIKSIISQYSKEIFLEFCGILSSTLIDIKNKSYKYKFNSITNQFLELLLNYFIDVFKNETKIDEKNKIFINIFDIYSNINEMHFNIFNSYDKKGLLFFFDYISTEIETKLKNKLYQKNTDFINIFINIFKNISETDLTGYNNAVFLKKISDILEYIFISYQMKLDKEKNKNIKELLMIDDNAEDITKLLKIIFHSVKVLEVLYLSNSEKKNNQMIYDFLVNKIIVKVCPKINDIILNFAVHHLKIIYPKIVSLDKENNNNINNDNNNKIIIIKNVTEDENQEREEIFEVISYIVLNKINYKSNFFFVEFKTTKNIYENLPFNYLFLNVFSKYLIKLFTRIIERTNLEDLSSISENMIILCLKGLYLLDGEINFTPNREDFWNNMQLVSKMTKDNNNKTLLLEKIKLIPFIFPLNIRLALGVQEIRRLKSESRNSISNMRNYINYYGYGDEEIDNDGAGHLKIPRNAIFSTTFMYYMQNMLPTYKRWVITFIDKLGQVEVGVDAGGLYKEFMYKLSEEAFSNKLGYFEESDTGLLFPTRDSVHVDKNYLYDKTYEFLGFIVAKAITDEIKIFPNFSPIFLNNCLDIENSFTDLKLYDPDLYKSLVTLKTYEGNVENDLGLYFSLTIEKDGKNVNFDLIDGGSNIPVTNENRLLYIKKVTDYYLTYQFQNAVINFRNGMSKVINMDIFRLYTGEELRQIIFGFDKDVFTVADMQENTNFNGFDMNDPKQSQCISDFFTILQEFSQKEKEKFLFFCTSLKRLPIGGFCKLRPKFTIVKSFSTVPTSSTCVNMLKLPILPYKKLKDILLYVINADAGFYYA